jgi:hypothetical protein
VNSSVKVANLNADMLDGLDSSAFQTRVAGSCPTGSAIRVINSNGGVARQGPAAISINKGGVPADGIYRTLATIDGIDVRYACASTAIIVELEVHTGGDTVFASGDRAEDGTLTSLQESGATVFSVASSTANLDVIAWAGSNGTLSRFDLGGFSGGTACNVWGLITPGT